ncbi:nuclear transport factor 2 family protein [Pseudoteredinibacter isoporae]|uniref:nuclear transport factor 2 family protein n=1 Tax=Pseudoteredinibacter isoporae TaxID=570281 RepID=UPI003101C4B7
MNDPRLEKWHNTFLTKDTDALAELLHPDMVFHSPTFWGAKEGGHVAHFILCQVLEIFQDFTYHREWVDGNHFALEFSCKVEDKNIRGIDLIEWNDEGQIVHFEVMVRPLNGLARLAEIMTQRFKDAGLLKQPT